MVWRGRNLRSSVPKRTVSQGEQILATMIGKSSTARSWWILTKAKTDQRGDNTHGNVAMWREDLGSTMWKYECGKECNACAGQKLSNSRQLFDYGTCLDSKERCKDNNVVGQLLRTEAATASFRKRDHCHTEGKKVEDSRNEE